jgi:serine/threonine protein kinase
VPEEGEVIAGRYRLMSSIGQGSMGVVWQARDEQLDRVVAVKLLNTDRRSPEAVAQMLREGRVAGRLRHPHAISVHEVVEHDGKPCLVLEYLPSRSLSALIAERGALPPGVVAAVGRQIAAALAAAHAEGIVHRDVSTFNVLLAEDGIAKITDFGIARLPNSAVKTMTGLILGSPRYMSPEQVIGKSIDARSDIFSLGVVLYEALTGVAPFDGDNVNAIMYATVNTSPPPPSQHNRQVPAMLDLIVAKAMAKLLEDRYQTVKEFADDLREVRRQLDSSRPATALKASNAPPPPKKPSSILGPSVAVDTSTVPLAAREERTGKEDEKPVPLAKTFDSFDATLRLAAMTDQTEDFREYISQTQKMRAYKGRIEGPLGAKMQQQAAATPAPPPVEERKPTRSTPRPMNLPGPQPAGAGGGSGVSNLIAIAAIVVLSVAALALTVALLVK